MARLDPRGTVALVEEVDLHHLDFRNYGGGSSREEEYTMVERCEEDTMEDVALNFQF